jgi:hypothetical protein
MIKGNFTIVLRVAVSSTEFQDVAVMKSVKIIRVELLCRSLGMRLLYGRDYKTSYNRTETPNPGYTGNKTVVDKSIIIQTPLCMWIIGPLLHISFSSIFSLYFPCIGAFILFIMFHGRRFVIIITGVFIIITTEVRIIRRIAYVRYIPRIMPIIKEDGLLLAS